MKMDLRRIQVLDKQDILKDILVTQIKKKKYIVYGARSIKNQSPFFARMTKDWDLFAKHPQKESDHLQKELDNALGFDYFYSKTAKHKGTWKVKNKGFDLRKGTEDDEDIADFSQPSGNIKFIIRDGIRFRNLKEEIKAKKKTLKDKGQKFRHKKDRYDLQRVKAYLKIKELSD